MTSTFMIFLLICPPMVLSASFNRIQLPPNATGLESLAFEPTTGRFYTGIADGGILKYLGPTAAFVHFGFVAPNRSKSLCDGIGTDNPNPACGRVVGLALHCATKRLYVCDAFFGFGVLDTRRGRGRGRGGQVTILSTSADGQPYRFCNAVDVHQPTGDVYFTDASAVYDIRQIEIVTRSNDSTWRLLKYEWESKQVKVLFRNLSFVGGVAVDKGKAAEFVLVSEFLANRTRKIYMATAASSSGIRVRQPAPDNIRRTESGNNFWLSVAEEESLVRIGQRLIKSAPFWRR